MGVIPRRGVGSRALRWGFTAALPLLAWLAVALQDVPSGLAAQPLVLPAPRYDPAQVRSPGLELRGTEAFPLEATLERGQSITGLLAELGLEPQDRLAVAAVLGEHVELRRLRPGLRASALLGPGARPASVHVAIPGQGRLEVLPSEAGWQGTWLPAVESVELRRAEVTIESTLTGALAAAGAPAEVGYRIADALQWDVDFGRDLRRGDRLQVLYQEVLLDGVPERVGDVLAVALWNRGSMVEAYRFGDGGYYDAQGRPLRKMFLRSPLAFSSRITSRFTHRRFHPILKSYRPHYGVDYGAPVGTPVRVTADGVVAFVGWDGGGGKTVKVRHPNGYLTAYLHLSGFAKGLRKGDRVRQEQVIGYVGSTGLSTAPHLDYRVQYRGKWIDPLSLKSVPAPALSATEMAVFAGWREQLRLALSAGAMPGAELPQWQLASAPAIEPPTAALGGR